MAPLIQQALTIYYVTIIHTSQPLLLRPYITATNMSIWSTFTALTSLWAILPPPLCLYGLNLQLLHYNVTYCLNNYYSSPILQQLLCLYDLCLQLLRHYDLNCRNHNYATKALYYSKYYVSMSYIYSPSATMLHSVSTTITQALYYSNYYVSMTYAYSPYVTMI